MGFRDRFYTPSTAKAILSWRILLGIAIAAVLTAGGLPLAVGIAIGAASYAVTVSAAMPSGPERPRIDPFTVQEPWRQFVQSAQRSAAKLHQTVENATDGPVKDRMVSIVEKLDQGLDEMWRIARRGHEIDEAVVRLDPTAKATRR